MDEKKRQWFNEPAEWREHGPGGTLEVTSSPDTDFWQKTHYGFVHDNGTFYYEEVAGDFTVDVKITGQYEELYDQAGLMLRLDEATWLKCGVEYVTGSEVVKTGGQQASVVVTRGGFSDWSVVPLATEPASFWIRAKREKGAVLVSYSLDGQDFKVLRLAYLTEESPLKVGPLVSSPVGKGFKTIFENYSLRQ